MELAFGPGTILLGKYRVEGVIGRGGMGLVLRVIHLHLGEDLAIKVLISEGAPVADLAARFLREAQAAAKLRGEHIVRVVDIGLLPEGLPYMVMEYLQGVDLAAELRQRKQLAIGDAVDYALQACDAIAEAHARGIVHRDIKPANLFLTSRPDGTPLIKVLDFGISKAPIQAHALTRTDVVMGTVGYMSPEQMKAAKDVDGRTDIWALGVVLYELLTGRPPFFGESYSAVVLLAGTEPPPPMESRIPRALQHAVLRCLEKNRQARFPNIAALVSALVPFAKDRRAAAMIMDSTSALGRRMDAEMSGARAVVAMAESGPVVTPQAPPMPPESPPTTASGRGQVSAISSSKSGSVRLFGFIAGVTILTVIVVIAVMQGGQSPRDDRRSATSRAELVVDRADAAGIVEAPIDAAMVAAVPIDAATVAAVPIDAATVAAVPIDAAMVAEVPVDAAIHVIARVDAAVAVVAPDASVHSNEQTELRSWCEESRAQKKWQDLLNCAHALESIVGSKRAAPYRELAISESKNEAIRGEIREALAKGYRDDAQRLLKQISPTSVYYWDAERAISAAAKAAAPAPPAPAPPAPVAPTNSATPPAANAASPSCDHAQIEVWIAAAGDQYRNGYPTEALTMINKALACSPDPRFFRFAATYACAAHDATAAKRYYAKVPADYQAAIQQKCQQEHTDLGLQPE